MTAHPTTHEPPRTGPAAPFDPALLAGLDEPVRRYFRRAIGDGAPLPDGVRVTMRGRIKLGAWLPFIAEQVPTPMPSAGVRASPPGR